MFQPSLRRFGLRLLPSSHDRYLGEDVSSYSLVKAWRPCSQESQQANSNNVKYHIKIVYRYENSKLVPQRVK